LGIGERLGCLQVTSNKRLVTRIECIGYWYIGILGETIQKSSSYLLLVTIYSKTPHTPFLTPHSSLRDCSSQGILNIFSSPNRLFGHPKIARDVWWDQTYGIRTVPELRRIVGLAVPNALMVLLKIFLPPDRLLDTENRRVGPAHQNLYLNPDSVRGAHP